MSTQPTSKTAIPEHVDGSVLSRMLEEGYGPGAWHGADLRAALTDVTPRDAFRRPAPGRHNVAEVALHHAFTVRSVIAQLTGREPGAFPLEGADWFELSDAGPLSWPDVLATLEAEQQQLTQVVGGLGAGKITSPLPEAERFDLVLGITAHAIYHAGQIQLIKVMLNNGAKS